MQTEDLYDVRLKATKLEYENAKTIINQNFLLFKQGLQKQWLEIKSKYITDCNKVNKLSVTQQDKIKYRAFLDKNINTKKKEFEASLRTATEKFNNDLIQAEEDHKTACTKLDSDFHWYLVEKQLKIDKSAFNKKVTEFKNYMSRKLSELTERLDAVKIKEHELQIKETALNIKEEELNKLQARLNAKKETKNSEFDWSSFRERFNIAKASPRRIYGKLDAIRFLELPDDYTDADIKKAYRTLSKRHHPDTCQITSQEPYGYHVNMFRLIQEAIDILKGVHEYR